jgi:hypothetical protein
MARLSPARKAETKLASFASRLISALGKPIGSLYVFSTVLRPQADCGLSALLPALLEQPSL